MGVLNNVVLKKEVDWSVLKEGLTLPQDISSIFTKIGESYLKRGEEKEVNFILYGKSYKAKVKTVNNASKFNLKHDKIQIRYNKDFADALRQYFYKSYEYICSERDKRKNTNDKSHIKLPEDYKEYIVIYTTEFDNTYLVETIEANDILQFKEIIKDQSELITENSFNNIIDDKSEVITSKGIIKVRRLNRAIGDNLKELYSYKCQICGADIGQAYGANIVEAHHIDYFIKSFNNDSNNILIVCPNHHSIIHDRNPVFNRKKLTYKYPNGYEEGLLLNSHLLNTP